MCKMLTVSSFQPGITTCFTRQNRGSLSRKSSWQSNHPRAVCCAADSSSAAGGAADIPREQKDSIVQATTSIQEALVVGGKGKKKVQRMHSPHIAHSTKLSCASNHWYVESAMQGFKVWSGVKRLAVEIPIVDDAAEAQLDLTEALMAAVPPAAGSPIVVFGQQPATQLARSRDVPFEVYSITECLTDLQDLSGPLLLVCTSPDQGPACEQLIKKHWSGKLILAVNAGWLRDTPADISRFAASFDIVYYFLPFATQGLFGGKTGFVLHWASSEVETDWQIFLDDRDVQCIGKMGQKPSQADIETAVYNAMASASPLTAGAKWFSNMKGKLSKDKDKAGNS